MARIIISLIAVATAFPFVIFFGGGQFADGGAVIVGIVTVGATLLIGVPLVLWYFKKRWFKLWQATFGGATVGLLLSPLLAFSGGTERFFYVATTFAALGCTHGIAFWFLAFWRNSSLPDPATSAAASPREQGAA
jgi:hypothetical protein